MPGVLVILRIALGGPKRKHHYKMFFCCCGRLPGDSPNVVDLFIGRCQAAHVPSRDRCKTTVLHVTVLKDSLRITDEPN
jgi:hypothetical protein